MFSTRKPQSKRRLSSLIAVATFLWTNVLFPYTAQTSQLPEFPELRSCLPELTLQSEPTAQDTDIIPFNVSETKKTISKQHNQEAPVWLRSIVGNYGKIKEVYLPTTDELAPVVIHIQDIHQHYEAQKNIAYIIRNVAAYRYRHHLLNNDPRTSGDKPLTPAVIGLEGASGNFNFSPYRAYSDKELTKDIAEYFMKSGMIGGPEFYGITAHEDLTLPMSGIENTKLYSANIEAFKSSLGLAKEANETIVKARMTLRHRKDRTLNPACLAFDRKREEYHEGKISLGQYIGFLGKLHQRALAVNSAMYVKAHNLEKSLDFAAVEKERSKIMELMSKNIPKTKTDDLLQLGLAYRKGSISFAEFYARFWKVAQNCGINMSEYPSLNKYVEYVTLVDKIVKTKLHAEIKDMETSLSNILAKTENEKALLQASHYLDLVKKLVNRTLTSEEWQEYRQAQRRKGTKAQSDGKAVIATPDLIGGKQSQDTSEIASSPSAPRNDILDLPLKSFEAFYEIAQQRNESLVSNLLNVVAQFTSIPSFSTGGEALSSFRKRGSGGGSGRSTTTPDESGNYKRNDNDMPPIAVLIAGGFHTKGISQLLKDKNIPFVTVMPDITKAGAGRTALELLVRDKTPLEKLFAGEKISLRNPVVMGPTGTNSPEEAIAEAATNLLYASAYITGQILKGNNVARAIEETPFSSFEASGQPRIRSDDTFRAAEIDTTIKTQSGDERKVTITGIATKTSDTEKLKNNAAYNELTNPSKSRKVASIELADGNTLEIHVTPEDSLRDSLDSVIGQIRERVQNIVANSSQFPALKNLAALANRSVAIMAPSRLGPLELKLLNFGTALTRAKDNGYIPELIVDDLFDSLTESGGFDNQRNPVALLLPLPGFELIFNALNGEDTQNTISANNFKPDLRKAIENAVNEANKQGKELIDSSDIYVVTVPYENNLSNIVGEQSKVVKGLDDMDSHKLIIWTTDGKILIHKDDIAKWQEQGLDVLTREIAKTLVHESYEHKNYQEARHKGIPITLNMLQQWHDEATELEKEVEQWTFAAGEKRTPNTEPLALTRHDKEAVLRHLTNIASGLTSLKTIIPTSGNGLNAKNSLNPENIREQIRTIKLETEALITNLHEPGEDLSVDIRASMDSMAVTRQVFSTFLNALEVGDMTGEGAAPIFLIQIDQSLAAITNIAARAGIPMSHIRAEVALSQAVQPQLVNNRENAAVAGTSDNGTSLENSLSGIKSALVQLKEISFEPGNDKEIHLAANMVAKRVAEITRLLHKTRTSVILNLNKQISQGTRNSITTAIDGIDAGLEEYKAKPILLKYKLQDLDNFKSTILEIEEATQQLETAIQAARELHPNSQPADISASIVRRPAGPTNGTSRPTVVNTEHGNISRNVNPQTLDADIQKIIQAQVGELRKGVNYLTNLLESEQSKGTGIEIEERVAELITAPEAQIHVKAILNAHNLLQAVVDLPGFPKDLSDQYKDTMGNSLGALIMISEQSEGEAQRFAAALISQGVLHNVLNRIDTATQAMEKTFKVEATRDSQGQIPAAELETGDKQLLASLAKNAGKQGVLEYVDRLLVVKALEMTNGVQKEAANLLGISQRVINYKIESHGIKHSNSAWKKNSGKFGGLSQEENHDLSVISRLVTGKADVNKLFNKSGKENQPKLSALARVDRILTIKALESAGWVQKKAAKLLGISQRQMGNRVWQMYQIELPSGNGKAKSNLSRTRGQETTGRSFFGKADWMPALGTLHQMAVADTTVRQSFVQALKPMLNALGLKNKLADKIESLLSNQGSQEVFETLLLPFMGISEVAKAVSSIVFKEKETETSTIALNAILKNPELSKTITPEIATAAEKMVSQVNTALHLQDDNALKTSDIQVIQGKLQGNKNIDTESFMAITTDLNGRLKVMVHADTLQKYARKDVKANTNNKLDNFLAVSLRHEIFEFNGFSHEEVVQAGFSLKTAENKSLTPNEISDLTTQFVQSAERNGVKLTVQKDAEIRSAIKTELKSLVPAIESDLTKAFEQRQTIIDTLDEAGKEEFTGLLAAISLLNLAELFSNNTRNDYQNMPLGSESMRDDDSMSAMVDLVDSYQKLHQTFKAGNAPNTGLNVSKVKEMLPVIQESLKVFANKLFETYSVLGNSKELSSKTGLDLKTIQGAIKELVGLFKIDYNGPKSADLTKALQQNMAGAKYLVNITKPQTIQDAMDKQESEGSNLTANVFIGNPLATNNMSDKMVGILAQQLIKVNDRLKNGENKTAGIVIPLVVNNKNMTATEKKTYAENVKQVITEKLQSQGIDVKQAFDATHFGELVIARNDLLNKQDIDPAVVIDPAIVYNLVKEWMTTTAGLLPKTDGQESISLNIFTDSLNPFKDWMNTEELAQSLKLYMVLSDTQVMEIPRIEEIMQIASEADKQA